MKALKFDGGNIYVACETDNGNIHPGGAPTPIISYTSGDGYVTSLDPSNGNTNWATFLGHVNYSDELSDLHINNGILYIAGQCYTSLPMPFGTTVHGTVFQQRDVFVTSFDIGTTSFIDISYIHGNNSCF